MKLKLALLTPLPPAASGIALFSRRILPLLAKKFDITVFSENIAVDIPNDSAFDILPLECFELYPSKKDFDLVLYQIGSNKIHCSIYLSALLRPGIAMLHEFVLHHLVKACTIGVNDYEAYTAEFAKYYGAEGEEMARLVHTGRAATETMFFHYPFYGRIAERSCALVTTTEYSKKNISSAYPSKKIYSSPICGCIETSSADRNSARKTLSIGDEFIIGIFGLISAAKKTDLVLDVFKRLQSKYPGIRLLLAGGIDPYYDLDADMKAHKIENGIIRTGRLSDEDYVRWLAAADVCVNLRYPIGGESSSALIEMMDAGKTVILPETGQFLEIPEDCAVHIPLGRDSRDALEAVIEEFIANPEELKTTGARAKAFAAERFSLERSASALVKTLEEIAGSSLPEPAPLSGEEKARFERLRQHFLKQDKG